MEAKCEMGKEDFFMGNPKRGEPGKQDNNICVGGSVAWEKRKGKRANRCINVKVPQTFEQMR